MPGGFAGHGDLEELIDEFLDEIQILDSILTFGSGEKSESKRWSKRIVLSKIAEDLVSLYPLAVWET